MSSIYSRPCEARRGDSIAIEPSSAGKDLGANSALGGFRGRLRFIALYRQGRIASHLSNLAIFNSVSKR